jgi:two-component system LytT family response regulator
MTKVLIIDDEKHCITTLEYILSNIEDVTIVNTTQDSTKAKDLIDKHQPDIVFLDIEMPILNGFDLLNQFETIPFKVVFTTAYDQYAIKALKVNALDYLLKPIDQNDIEQVLEKYNAKELNISKDQLNHLHQFINGKMQDTIALSTQEGLHFVKIDEILYLEASSCYTFIVMNDKMKHLASKTLANFEDVLKDNSLFFRAHKSHIINLKFIKQYIRGEGGEIIMQDGKNIALSRNKKQEFLSLFKKV